MSCYLCNKKTYGPKTHCSKCGKVFCGKGYSNDTIYDTCSEKAQTINSFNCRCDVKFRQREEECFEECKINKCRCINNCVCSEECTECLIIGENENCSCKFQCRCYFVCICFCPTHPDYYCVACGYETKNHTNLYECINCTIDYNSLYVSDNEIIEHLMKDKLLFDQLKESIKMNKHNDNMSKNSKGLMTKAAIKVVKKK